MKMKTTTSLAVVALALAASSHAPARVDAVEILFRNLCEGQMVLSDGNTTEKIKEGGSTKHTLPPGSIRAYRYSKSNQATLAEFSVQETTTWYDIGIIPTGKTQGPGQCGSLEECKEVTGGTGFNVPMKIVPGKSEDASVGDYCRTLDCFADGCEDAYQFPHDKDKTHNCPADVHFTVIFCATPSTGSTDGSLGWASLESAEIDNSELKNTVPSSAPTPSPQAASTFTGNDSDGGTSVAVIIAAVVGGLVTVFVAVVLVRRFRYYRLERMNERRYSSEAMVFIEATDKNTL